MLILADSDAVDVIPVVAIVFTFIWLIVKAIMAPFTERYRSRTRAEQAGGLTQEEAALLEKLHRTLVQMERRVESLETILIETHRTKETYGTK
jgi:ribonuclease PH